MARDHVVAETAEEGMPIACRSAQPGVEKAGRVGEQVERRSRPVQTLDQIRHLRERVVEHLVEPAVEGFDQGLLARMVRRQAAGRFGWVAAPVLQAMPLRRGHRGEETLHFLRIRDQLAVEMAGVPVEQDAAHVEDRDRGCGSACFLGGFWGQFRAFPEGVFGTNLLNKNNKLKSAHQSVFCWSSGAGLLGWKSVPPGPLAGP